LILLGKLNGKNGLSGDFTNNLELPTVDLLIAAFNEEKVILGKLQNALSLDYPIDKIRIFVVSDGSSDQTNNIVEDFIKNHDGVYLILVDRGGKANAINKAFPLLTSQIVLFSDANTELESGALRLLVRNFEFSDVGCVSGRLIYRNPGSVLSGVGESFYWKFETALKILESNLGYIAGANGAIYAIRRELFEPFKAGTVNDDFTLSMKIVQKGYKSLYEESALAYEDVAPSSKSEFRRHIRDASGHYVAIFHLWKLLNPLRGYSFLVFFSHRFLRWSVPFYLIVLFLLDAYLMDKFLYYCLFVMQLSFYASALLGLIMVRYGRVPFIFYAPYYFCNLNFALFIGFFKALVGRQITQWNSTERV
jgi:cellulose synthase/poly-beta-1,6-N-acetylglucosamine synthase-like glycosyltransferase